MSLSSAKAKLDAQGGDPVTGYISKTDHQESYDELVDDTALTGATTAEALDVTGALTAGTIASDATVAGTGLAGGLLSSANPVINGVAAPGTSAIPSRQDHVHAIDTTRAALASPTFTGTVTIPSGLVLGTVTHTEGTGSPQGVVTAVVGSTYIDTAATTGAVKWLKASGSGSSGWVVEYGDTGWREVAMVNSWSGSVYLRRIGATVHMRGWNSADGVIDSTSASSNTFVTVASGFIPSIPERSNAPVGVLWKYANPVYASYYIVADTAGAFWCPARTNDLYLASFSYLTADAWPSSLPGSAA